MVSLWADIRKRFEASGVDTPVIDARLLLEAGAGVARLDIITDPRRALSQEQVDAVELLVARRLKREPVAHIVGAKAFWTIELKVSPAVLIPRPETELLVESVLTFVAPDDAARILDLGVGSGAILLAALRERPNAVGVGVDLSEAALEIAQANAEALGLRERVRLVQGDWGAGLAEAFDVVVSNPPYIPTSHIAGLAPEVADHEPHLALDGGADGLDAYRTIISQLPGLLRPGGGFALEVGMGQAADVYALAEAAGLDLLPNRADLAGIERVVWGKRRA
ncbi:protein-N(5)-glutamine methyltransferase PrmC [alpha proteobacterium U9-1i]|nr:protein-N(5)-glutamine methyltransferase PrmC [alpha proteobacterium U9-1i]